MEQNSERSSPPPNRDNNPRKDTNNDHLQASSANTSDASADPGFDYCEGTISNNQRPANYASMGAFANTLPPTASAYYHPTNNTTTHWSTMNPPFNLNNQHMNQNLMSANNPFVRHEQYSGIYQPISLTFPDPMGQPVNRHLQVTPVPTNLSWRQWIGQAPTPPRFGPAQHAETYEPCPFDTVSYVDLHFPRVTQATRKGLSIPVRKLDLQVRVKGPRDTEYAVAGDLAFDGYSRPLAYYIHLLHPLGIALRFEVEYLIADDIVTNNVRFRERYDPAHENLQLSVQIQDSFGEWKPPMHFASYCASDAEYPLSSSGDGVALRARVDVKAPEWPKTAMDSYLHYGAYILNLPITSHPLQLSIIKSECHYFDRTYFLREVGRKANGEVELTPLYQYNPTHFGEPRRCDADEFPLFASTLNEHLLYEPKHPANGQTDRLTLKLAKERCLPASQLRPPVLVGKAKDDADRLQRMRTVFNRTPTAAPRTRSTPMDS